MAEQNSTGTPPIYPQPQFTSSASAPSVAPVSASADKSEKQTGSTKEFIESMLVALMFAFIFRAFIVEAFIIPTGSMAPTLLGAHLRFTCPNCGYEYDMGYEGQSGPGGELVIPDRDTKQHSPTCPNCGYVIPSRQAENHPVMYGDRILVLKYSYLLQEPARWDVVVFKAPAEPQNYHYQTNYIKRLIGTPNEAIMILDGDVYVARQKDQSPDQWATGPLSLADFQIQRKPVEAQDALWRIVYDADFVPRGLTSHASSMRDRNGNSPQVGWTNPWEKRDNRTGWTLPDDPADPHGFKYDNLAGSAALNFNINANPSLKAFRDWLAYDVDSSGGSDRNGVNYVSDVKMDFYYTRQEGDGPLNLKLRKKNTTVVAMITATDVSMTVQAGDDAPAQAVGAKVPMRLATNAHIEFQNVDYRVTLKIDGKIVIQTNDQQYGPDVPELMKSFERATVINSMSNLYEPPPVIEITAANQKCQISHLRLYRDNYYGNNPFGNPGPSLRPEFARNALAPDLRANAHMWGTPFEFPNNIIRLNADEFFVMGDNSPVSADARYWGDPVLLPAEELHLASGRVPRQFLLGRAFFVYWPAGYSVYNSPSIVPNFGEMRFIH